MASRGYAHSQPQRKGRAGQKTAGGGCEVSVNNDDDDDDDDDNHTHMAWVHKAAQSGVSRVGGGWLEPPPTIGVHHHNNDNNE